MSGWWESTVGSLSLVCQLSCYPLLYNPSIRRMVWIAFTMKTLYLYCVNEIQME